MKLLYEAISCSLTWVLGIFSLILVPAKRTLCLFFTLTCCLMWEQLIDRTNRVYTGAAYERMVFLANLLPDTLYKFIDVSNSPNDSWQNKRTGLTLASVSAQPYCWNFSFSAYSVIGNEDHKFQLWIETERRRIMNKGETVITNQNEFGNCKKFE